MEITTLIRRLAAGALLEQLELRPGSEVAVRVQAAPLAGGRGTISLAGALLPAELPPGLRAGQKLNVQVVRSERGELLLKVLADPQPPAERGDLPRAAGALAVSGEPRLVEAANGLQQPGLALPLPNGDALTLAIPPEDREDDELERRGGGEGEAAFVLHSAAIGPIEVRLRLGGGTLGVSVVVDPGAEPLARAAAPELVRALARTTAAQPNVEIAARAARGARPAPPRVEESFDAYA